MNAKVIGLAAVLAVAGVTRANAVDWLCRAAFDRVCTGSTWGSLGFGTPETCRYYPSDEVVRLSTQTEYGSARLSGEYKVGPWQRWLDQPVVVPNARWTKTRWTSGDEYVFTLSVDKLEEKRAYFEWDRGMRVEMVGFCQEN